MSVLLIAAVAGMVLAGYACMGRIDRFLETEVSPPPREEVRPAEGVLLFGADDEAQEVARHLEESRPDVRRVSGPEVPEYPRCEVLLALSEDDRANLLLCSRIQRLCPEAIVVARCNDPIYRELFAGTDARRVLAVPCCAEDVLDALRGLRVI